MRCIDILCDLSPKKVIFIFECYIFLLQFFFKERFSRVEGSYFSGSTTSSPLEKPWTRHYKEHHQNIFVILAAVILVFKWNKYDKKFESAFPANIHKHTHTLTHTHTHTLVKYYMMYVWIHKMQGRHKLMLLLIPVRDLKG